VPRDEHADERIDRRCTCRRSGYGHRSHRSSVEDTVSRRHHNGRRRIANHHTY
jgi:hypothetical protein